MSSVLIRFLERSVCPVRTNGRQTVVLRNFKGLATGGIAWGKEKLPWFIQVGMHSLEGFSRRDRDDR